jgi:hypothetical protein
VHLQRQIGERGHHGVPGAGQVEPELRVTVQRATQRHGSWLDAPSVSMQSVDRGTR